MSSNHGKKISKIIAYVKWHVKDRYTYLAFLGMIYLWLNEIKCNILKPFMIVFENLIIIEIDTLDNIQYFLKL